MEPFFVEVLPDAQDDKSLSSHEGEEFIMVLTGEIELFHGRERYRLSPGDSVYFNSVVPHYVGCCGEDKAEICAVLYCPR